MLFSSSVFLFVFLPAVLAVYYILLRGMRQAQNIFLLLVSLFFYAWGEPRFLPVMVLSILANYGFGRWVYRRKFQCRHVTLPVALAVGCNLGLLFVFKYLAFTVESLNTFGLGLTVPLIDLPIGISFFTFQALSYVLDVAMGKVEVQRSPLDLGLYISFFPQLIAGPIVKYSTVARQIRGRQENWADFSAGCARFLTGLGKKVLIANQMAVVADRVFAVDPASLSTPMAWLGSLCYTFQIYYDFSGYSDMAIGLGLMFGFHFLENFDHPYAACSVSQFWRRWHISLSTWFRDYLYIPLGGNRVDKKKHIRNLFVVWLLTGLWHGANWTFVLWGLFYFLLLYLEKFHHLGRGWPAPLGWLYTVVAVNFLWMLFRSDTVSYAGGYLLTMLGLNGTGTADSVCGLYFRENWVILLLALLFSFPFADRVREAVDASRRCKVDIALLWDLLYALGLLAVGILCTCYLVKGTYNPFIYFRF
jgi:D-alanyl-lipoteichoic acid acyltransferase DltB (MBOAT superfamily)